MMRPDTARQPTSAAERHSSTFYASVPAPRLQQVELHSAEHHPGAQLRYTPPETEQPWGLDHATQDGVTHINIYNRGATELGRQLAHYTKKPFMHPFYGKFNSMEGFWYYLKAAYPDDTLRHLAGRDAKFYGRELPPGPRYESFCPVVIEANFYKIIQHPELRELMTASTLPFDHYYLTPGSVMVRLPYFGWLLEGFEAIRRELHQAAKAGLEPAWPTPVYEAHVR